MLRDMSWGVLVAVIVASVLVLASVSLFIVSKIVGPTTNETSVATTPQQATAPQETSIVVSSPVPTESLNLDSILLNKNSLIDPTVEASPSATPKELRDDAVTSDAAHSGIVNPSGSETKTVIPPVSQTLIPPPPADGLKLIP